MMAHFDKDELYRLLRRIPKGKVMTYGALARQMGNKKWARSVGNALHQNPDGDLNPCYKIVNSRGFLSENYAFGGLISQKRRLEADGISVEENRVDLFRYGIEKLK